MPAFIDLTGRKFGNLAVTDQAPTRNRATRWNCLCGCGTAKIVDGRALRAGLTNSCGKCHYQKTVDITGKKFHRLTAMRQDGVINHQAFWKCLCDCGNSLRVKAGDLSSGRKRSCGCVAREKAVSALALGVKNCSKCKRLLPLERFTKKAKMLTGLSPTCRDCERDYTLRHSYGVTPEAYGSMLSAQLGQCAICGDTGGAKRLVVDHDHSTGKVRELLCASCNQALGFLRDSQDIAIQAARYLRKHSESAERAKAC